MTKMPQGKHMHLKLVEIRNIHWKTFVTKHESIDTILVCTMKSEMYSAKRIRIRRIYAKRVITRDTDLTQGNSCFQ